MNSFPPFHPAAACLATLIFTLAALARAQTSIPRSKIAGGGATTPSNGGVYAVSGTIGQPDANSALTGGV